MPREGGGPEKTMMNKPAQGIKEHEDQGGRRVGDVLVDAKKIREVVNKRKSEGEKKESPSTIPSGEQEDRDEKREKGDLERLGEGDIALIEKKETDSCDGSRHPEETFGSPDVRYGLSLIRRILLQ